MKGRNIGDITTIKVKANKEEFKESFHKYIQDGHIEWYVMIVEKEPVTEDEWKATYKKHENYIHDYTTGLNVIFIGQKTVLDWVK